MARGWQDQGSCEGARDCSDLSTAKEYASGGVLAELERSLISERTSAGVKDAQRWGVKFGRKPKLTPQQIGHALKMIDAGERREDVADLFKVSRTTLYRALA